MKCSGLERLFGRQVQSPQFTSALSQSVTVRYDGTPLWDVRGVPGVHDLVWVLNFISFYFLYPSTFNILEVGVEHVWLAGWAELSLTHS